jgi:hypothetical protein
MPTAFESSWRNVLSAAEEAAGGASGYMFVSTGSGFGYPIIITEYRVSQNEKVQVLEAFKERIHAYAFGRAVGQATISGMSLEHTGTNSKHRKFGSKFLASWRDRYRALAAAKRGALVAISGPGNNMVIRGVSDNVEYGLSSQQSNLLSFSMRILIVDSATGIG